MDASASDEVFEARVSRRKLLLIAIGGACLVVGGLWSMGVFGSAPASSRYPPAFTFVVALVATPFFGLCMLALLFRLRQTGPVMRIDETGIWLKGRYEITIPWHQVTRLGMTNIKGQRMIGLDVKEPSLIAPIKVTRWMIPVNRRISGYAGSISVIGLDRSFEDLVAAIRRFSPVPLDR